MYKVGDKLICKNLFISDNKIIRQLEIGKEYTIIDDSYELYTVDGYNYGRFTNEGILKYFYTEKELRMNKLKRLNNV